MLRYVKVSILPTSRLLIHLRQKIDVTEKLDYPNAQIVLCVDSTTALARIWSCSKEPRTVEWIEQTFVTGDIFLDIGSNVGVYSLIAHSVTQGKCLIYAIEPGFSTFSLLSRNILLNNAQESIVPLLVALGDETEVATFHYKSIFSGEASHGGIRKNSNSIGVHRGARQALRIPCFRLDDLISSFQIECPTHVKIDVDGYECKVLAGATNVLSCEKLRYVLIEITDNSNAASDIYHILERHGFCFVAKHPLYTPGMFNCLFERR
jgi:FkbM family methyltransferase